MHVVGFVCALSLSVIDSGFQLEWDPHTGPPPSRWLPNHPSAREHAAFVTVKVAEGCLSGTMVSCSSDSLACILPLGIAADSAGKLCLM
jgi:hypothetical protein